MKIQAFARAQICLYSYPNYYSTKWLPPLDSKICQIFSCADCSIKLHTLEEKGERLLFSEMALNSPLLGCVAS